MMSSLSSSFPSRIIQMVQRPYIWAYYIIFQSLVYRNLSDHGAFFAEKQQKITSIGSVRGAPALPSGGGAAGALPFDA